MIKKLQSYRLRFSESEFLKSIAAIFSANLIAQALPFLIEPIIARIYTPSDFAVLTLFISITSIFSIVATGRYEMAIVLPSDPHKAINVFFLSILLTIAVSTFSLIVILLFNEFIIQILQNKEIEQYLYFVPITVLFIGFYQSLNYFAIRNKHFNSVSYSRISQTVTNSGLNLAFGWAQLKSFGLLMAYLIGQFIALIPLTFRFFKGQKDIFKEFNWTTIKQQAKVYSDFPKINSAHAFSDIIFQSGTVFLISRFFGQITLGLYSRTLRLLFAPVSIIASAIGQVFFQKASSEYASSGNIFPLVKKTVVALFFVATPIFTVSMLFGDDIFAFVLGDNWRIAGEYAQILSPWICLNFIATPISQIPMIVGKQKRAFALSLIGNSIIIASMLYGGLIAKDIKTAFYILSFLEVIFYFYLISWYLKVSNSHP